MPTIKCKRGPLKVQRRFWPGDDSGPKTAYWDGHEWVPCRDYQAARDYAAVHGYTGIKIKLV